jgi:hypothetical protein
MLCRPSRPRGNNIAGFFIGVRIQDAGYGGFIGESPVLLNAVGQSV